MRSRIRQALSAGDPSRRAVTEPDSAPEADRDGSVGGEPEPLEEGHIVFVEDVSVTLGDVSALENVSVTVDSGEFLGIIGPNGAGKTTLLRTISNVLRPDSGRIEVAGRAVSNRSARETSRLVAVVPQTTSLAFDFDVRSVVEMGRTPYRPRFSLTRPTDDSIIEEAMDAVTVTQFADRSIEAISGGERQRVLLARAIAQDTPVLLLDEPTASLDINHQVRTLELIRDLVDQRQKTVLAPIHDLNLAAHYCDRLLLLGDGRRLAAGRPSTVLTESNLESAFETDAVVTRHPVTGSAYVMAMPHGTGKTTKAPVHVIGGGGNAARLLYLLSAAGYDVSVGALNEGDADLETARMLGIDAVTLDPYAGMETPDYEAVKERIRTAAVTVVADIEVGSGNLPNLRAALEADSIVVVNERPFEKRNYAGKAGEELYETLQRRGTVIEPDELLPTVEDAVNRSNNGTGSPAP